MFFFLINIKKKVETNAIVESLQKELTALAPVLKEKGEAAEIMITQVTAESEAADKVRVKVEADEVVVAKQAAEVKVIADDAQADLDVAMPALAKGYCPDSNSFNMRQALCLVT